MEVAEGRNNSYDTTLVFKLLNKIVDMNNSEMLKIIVESKNRAYFHILPVQTSSLGILAMLG